MFVVVTGWGLCSNGRGHGPGDSMTTEQDTTELAERVEEALRGDDVERAAEVIASLHPADRADLYERLDPELREAFFSVLSTEQMAELMEYLDEEVRGVVTARMTRVTLARVLDRTSNDVAVDVLRTLPPSDMSRVLSAMSTAQEISPLLEHADESAGGLMTRGYVALHPEMTVQQAITFLRLRKPLADEAYYLYVLDASNRLQGVVNLRELILSEADTRIEDVMTKDPIAVDPNTDQEDCLRLFERYRLRALPVVDEQQVLRGIITFDDIMNVSRWEADEDIYEIVGLPAEESIFSPLSVSLRRRMPWLFLNLLAAAYGAAVVGVFEDTIAKAAALAVFMPIVAGQSGSSGIQTITLMVRGLASGDLERRHLRHALLKEVTTGLVKGLLFAVVVGGAALAWQGEWAWGPVVGLAMIGNMTFAGALGVIIPMTLRRMHLDPAVASGIVVTSFTDVMGFLLLLGMGTLLISELR